MSRNLIVLVVVTLSAAVVRGQPLEEERNGLTTEIQRFNQKDAEIRSKFDSLQSDFDTLDKRESQVTKNDNEINANQTKIAGEVHSLAKKVDDESARLDANKQRLVRENSDLDSAIDANNKEGDAIDAAGRTLNTKSQFEVDRFNLRVDKHNKERRVLIQKQKEHNAAARQYASDRVSLEATKKRGRDLEDEFQKLSKARARNHADGIEFARTKKMLEGRRDELNIARAKLRDDAKDLAQRVADWNAKASKATRATKPGARLDFDYVADDLGKGGKPVNTNESRKSAQDEIRDAKDAARRAEKERKSLDGSSKP
jgi:predicted  nucleic acid-binding Zn-ribbon protein